MIVDPEEFTVECSPQFAIGEFHFEFRLRVNPDIILKARWEGHFMAAPVSVVEAAREEMSIVAKDLLYRIAWE